MLQYGTDRVYTRELFAEAVEFHCQFLCRKHFYSYFYHSRGYSNAIKTMWKKEAKHVRGLRVILSSSVYNIVNKHPVRSVADCTQWSTGITDDCSSLQPQCEPITFSGRFPVEWSGMVSSIISSFPVSDGNEAQGDTAQRERARGLRKLGNRALNFTLI